MRPRTLCILPLMLSSVIAMLVNISMVVHILTRKKRRRDAVGWLITLIGISNIFSAMSYPMKAVTSRVVPHNSMVWATTTIMTVAMLAQIGFNIALAFERLQAAMKPLQYHIAANRRSLERRLTILVASVSMILAVASSTIGAVMNEDKVVFTTLSTSHIVRYILLTCIYYRLFMKMKMQNGVLSRMGRQTRSTCLSVRRGIFEERRNRQLSQYKNLFIGITTSYFILTLPMVVVLLVIKEMQSCDENGAALIAAVASLTLANFNMVFDASWYFYIVKRSSRLEPTAHGY